VARRGSTYIPESIATPEDRPAEILADPSPLEEALEETASPLQEVESEPDAQVQEAVAEVPKVIVGQIVHFHIDDEEGRAIRLQAEVTNVISSRMINLKTFKFRGARLDHFGVHQGRRVGQWDFPY